MHQRKKTPAKRLPVPFGLTKADVNAMRARGKDLPALCKLGKWTVVNFGWPHIGSCNVSILQEGGYCLVGLELFECCKVQKQVPLLTSFKSLGMVTYGYCIRSIHEQRSEAFVVLQGKTAFMSHFWKILEKRFRKVILSGLTARASRPGTFAPSEWNWRFVFSYNRYWRLVFSLLYWNFSFNHKIVSDSRRFGRCWWPNQLWCRSSSHVYWFPTNLNTYWCGDGMASRLPVQRKQQF